MKKYLDLLKENFSLLVAIPPLFGAIWQLIELSKISLSYIRFFSISQLVADGALFLIALLLLLASSIWVNFVSNSMKEVKENSEEEKQKYFEKFLEVKKPSLIYSILYILIGLSILIGGILYANAYFLKNINSLVVIWFIIPANILIIVVGYSLFLKGIKHVENIFSENRNNRLKAYTTLLLILFFFDYTKNYYSEFNKLMLLPNNLENMKEIESDIKNKYPNTTVILKYLNDKFIFYSIIDKNKKEKIKIVKFDNLFEE